MAGQIAGVHLAPDSVGQHQIGIDPLLRRLGAPEPDSHGLRTFDEHLIPSLGSFERTELTHEEKLYLDAGSKAKKLRSTSTALCVGGNLEHAVEECRRYSPLSLITGAWDDASFAIRGYGDEGRRIIDLVQEGLATGDLAIWISGSIDLGYGHLCLARRSLVPTALVEAFNSEIEDRRRLLAAADATGIADKLQSIGRMSVLGRGRPYHALSPAWIDHERAKHSVHPVKFFLNPSQQNLNNFGWFTVEELEQWIEGRGPVPKMQQREKE
ncbi:hypothetical protein [Sphingomonas sp. 3-13AW]|uniref:hypothetical protein n=1 Tax=Sphingomonas sp. 3-13AW TaxID=3050450 RepID=UPI003BB4E697